MGICFVLGSVWAIQQVLAMLHRTRPIRVLLRAALAFVTGLSTTSSLVRSDEHSVVNERTSSAVCLADVQRPPETPAPDAPELTSLLVNHGEPIRDLESWNIRREEIRREWLEFIQPLMVERARLKLKLAGEDRVGTVVRQRYEYESEPGIAAEGYLLRPARVKSRLPGVVVLHSTTPDTIRQPAGLVGDERLAFALRLAERGYITFCPECFLWEDEGTYEDAVHRLQTRHPRSKGIAKMLFDAQRSTCLGRLAVS